MFASCSVTIAFDSQEESRDSCLETFTLVKRCKTSNVVACEECKKEIVELITIKASSSFFYCYVFWVRFAENYEGRKGLISIWSCCYPREEKQTFWGSCWKKGVWKVQEISEIWVVDDKCLKLTVCWSGEILTITWRTLGIKKKSLITS